MWLNSWVSGPGRLRSRRPPSWGWLFALRPLQRRQATTWFSQVLGAPPRETGTTWSMVSSEAGPPTPQYWQGRSSRGGRLGRVGREGSPGHVDGAEQPGHDDSLREAPLAYCGLGLGLGLVVEEGDPLLAQQD